MGSVLIRTILLGLDPKIKSWILIQIWIRIQPINLENFDFYNQLNGTPYKYYLRGTKI
jgi:hypothetical protein